jgi:tyrosyl-tRNA synthetase
MQTIKRMTLDEQLEYLMQGTEYGDEVLRRSMAEELRHRLSEAQREGRPLRVYCGYDPRTSDLHLGHTVTMRKLRQFQELGHEVTFLIGTYTSLIGDPSDKDKLRLQLSLEQTWGNARTYAEQAFRILDRERTTVRYNSEWLQNLTFAELIQLASHFTLQQFLTRENFRQRWEQGSAIYLHETFYALMQAYDASVLRADVQVGGTDQLFNIMTAARKGMTALGMRPNICIILGILPGTDGLVKMSKSLGNHIPLGASPNELYAKLMSIPDGAMDPYARLVTRWTPDEIRTWKGAWESGKLHPRDAKMRLAFEITTVLHGEVRAAQAEETFSRVFRQGSAPLETPEIEWPGGQSLIEVLAANGLARSRSEGRRLVQQNGVRLDGVVLQNPLQALPHPGLLQVGKRSFVRVRHPEVACRDDAAGAKS